MKNATTQIPENFELLAEVARNFENADEFIEFIEKDILDRKVLPPLGVRNAPSEIADKIIQLKKIIGGYFTKKNRAATEKEAYEAFLKAKEEGRGWARGRSFKNPSIRLRAIAEATRVDDIGLDKEQLINFYNKIKK
jgi:hypothetical protein